MTQTYKTVLPTHLTIDFLNCSNQIKEYSTQYGTLRLPICPCCGYGIVGGIYIQRSLESLRYHEKCYFDSHGVGLRYRENWYNDSLLGKIDHERLEQWELYLRNHSSNSHIQISVPSREDRIDFVCKEFEGDRTKEIKPSRCYECEFYKKMDDYDETKGCHLNPYEPEDRHPFASPCDHGYKIISHKEWKKFNVNSS